MKLNQKSLTKLERHNLTPLIYYDKDDPKEIITNCLLVRDGKCVATGYAMCSAKDVFNKKIGRNIAVGRAIKEYEMFGEVIDIELDDFEKILVDKFYSKQVQLTK